MAKKEAKLVKRISKPIKLSRDTEKLNEILIENFVNLQKVLTNLATKFEDLSIQMSKLLQLFEISAKSFAEKLATGIPEIEKDREFLDKLNALLEQNKVIAKGLTLMEEKIRERVYGQTPTPQTQMQQSQMRFQPPQPPYSYTPSMLGKEKKPEEQ